MALQRGIRIHQYLDDWLVRASTHDTCLQHTQTLVTLCQELGWLVKSQNWLPTGFQLHRLPVQPERGQGQTHTRALAGLDRQDPVNTVRSGTPGPAVHVPHRDTHSNRKASPPRATSHVAHTVALGKQLEGPRVTRKGDPGPQIAPFPSKVVAGGKQCAARSGQPLHPLNMLCKYLHMHQKKGGALSLRRAHCKGNLVPSRSKLHINHLELKAVFLAPEEFRTLYCNKTVLIATDNSGCLYQQRGGDEVGLSVCPAVEILSWCTRQQITLRARHTPGRLNVIADKLFKLGQTIQTEWSL